MKIIKLMLTCIVFAVGIISAVFAKSSETKRLNSDSAYYQDSNGFWKCVKLCAAQALFRSAGVSPQATITDSNGNQRPLYTSQNTSDPAAFDYP
jgi:hypothetical protein